MGHLQSAATLRPGCKIYGPRGFHITVERVRATPKAVIVEGVNGWGEGVKIRYERSKRVEVLEGAK